MADLSALGGLNPIDKLELGEKYAAVKEKTAFQLPPKGRYDLRAPESFPQAAFSRTKAGALQVQIDPTIVGPTGEGLVVKFVKISAKTWKRGDEVVSQVGDYLTAHGFKGSIKTEQDLADAVESTANQVYAANLDWRGYSKTTGWSIQGMERFPQLPDGSYQSWIDDPTPGAFAL